VSGSASSAAVYNIVAFCFTDRAKAGQVMKELEANQTLEGYAVRVHAVVEVDEHGKSHVHEPGHGVFGTGVGAVGGGLLALIGGPIGVLGLAVAGGVIGGVLGKHFGKAIPEKDLKELGDQLGPNSSALLALIEDVATEQLINGLQGLNATVITLTVGDEMSGEIAQAVSAEVTTDGTA
jgi:uncharacterized membrane protein